MRGFGHSKGNEPEIFPGLHGGHEQDQVAKSHAWSAWAGATLETSTLQPRFGGLGLKLEMEPKQPRQWAAGKATIAWGIWILALPNGWALAAEYISHPQPLAA
jgi:hypothetical protein